MKPTAYITQDRRMLIFADSPNMMPADTNNLIPLFELEAIAENLNTLDEFTSTGCRAEVIVGIGGRGDDFTGYCEDAAKLGGRKGNKEGSNLEECRGFKINDPIAYWRFHSTDKPILGRIRSLTDREGARGAWIADSETGEVYFAPFSRLAHLKLNGPRGFAGND